jgi:hypothetical protein
MIRISLPYLFALANALEPLSSIRPDDQRGDTVVKIFQARQQLDGFLNSSIYISYIRSSRELGIALLRVLDAFDLSNVEKQIAPREAWQVTNSYMQYKIALSAELSVAPTFFVSPKTPFDTDSLLRDGESLLPPDLSIKVPEAIFDTREAGKCLAYEIPTAAGFHILRAAESVVRRYYSHVTGGAAPPKVRNFMVYIGALKKFNVGDPKILSSLEQIVRLHRNPLIHPEDVLSVSEAISLIGIVRSAVMAMLAVLPDAPLTTSTISTVSQGAP